MQHSQAQAAASTQPLGQSRRWSFNEMQQLKGKKVDASLDEEHKLTEIFVMLPLDIISVGEVLEGGPSKECMRPNLQNRRE